MYERFGFRGPFIFGIGCSVADLVGRLVIIERKDALRWGVDPAAEVEVVQPEARDEEAQCAEKPPVTVGEAQVANEGTPQEDGEAQTGALPAPGEAEEGRTSPSAATPQNAVARTTSNSPSHKPHFSAMQVLHKLRRSPRAIVTVFMTFVWGYVFALQ